jgi:hypothetical protein
MDYSAPTGSRWKLAPSGSPAKATISAPTTATTSAPVACRRRRPPQRMRRGPCPRPPTGVRTRPSKNATATSTAYDVLYDPLGSIGAVRPTVQETPRIRWTCARRDRRPCGGRTATPHLAAGGSVGGGTKTIKAKEMEPQHDSLPTPKNWGARGMESWLGPLSTFTRLVIILPPKCWRKKREGASPPQTSRGGRRRWPPEGRSRTPRVEAGGQAPPAAARRKMGSAGPTRWRVWKQRTQTLRRKGRREERHQHKSSWQIPAHSIQASGIPFRALTQFGCARDEVTRPWQTTATQSRNLEGKGAQRA